MNKELLAEITYLASESIFYNDKMPIVPDSEYWLEYPSQMVLGYLNNQNDSQEIIVTLDFDSKDLDASVLDKKTLEEVGVIPKEYLSTLNKRYHNIKLDLLGNPEREFFRYLTKENLNTHLDKAFIQNKSWQEYDYQDILIFLDEYLKSGKLLNHFLKEDWFFELNDDELISLRLLCNKRDEFLKDMVRFEVYELCKIGIHENGRIPEKVSYYDQYSKKDRMISMQEFPQFLTKEDLFELNECQNQYFESNSLSVNL